MTIAPASSEVDHLFAIPYTGFQEQKSLEGEVIMMSIKKLLKIPVAAVVLIASVAWILLKAAVTILGLIGSHTPRERDDVEQMYALDRTLDPDNKYQLWDID